MAKPSRQNIYQFDEFRLDASHLMLSRDNREIQLAPKAIETLLALVERRGEIVSKDELLEAIWPDTAVEESNLFLYLSVLRKTLGTQASGEPYLETLRRRGYRFIGDVSVVDTADEEELRLFEDNGMSGGALTQADPGLVRKERHREDWPPSIDRLTVTPSPSSTARPFEEPRYGGSAPVTGVSQSTAANSHRERSDEFSRKRFWLVFLLGAILITVGATVPFYWRSEPVAVSTAHKPKTLAILPFRPLIDGQYDEQFELGMADTYHSPRQQRFDQRTTYSFCT